MNIAHKKADIVIGDALKGPLPRIEGACDIPYKSYPLAMR